MTGPEVLRETDINKLAIANPKLAPYGAAVVQVLQALGLRDALESRLVRGENIAQSYQFVHSGNATLGFVARSQVYRGEQLLQGSAWPVPSHLHAPIRQDAVLLTQGTHSSAAKALLKFVRSETAHTIIHDFGYGVE